MVGMYDTEEKMGDYWSKPKKKCPLCPKEYQSEKELDRHMKKYHDIKFGETMTEDKLEKIFEMQEKLQRKIRGHYPYTYDQEYINLMFIGCITEACELLEKTPWKPWKKSHVEKRLSTVSEQTKEEVIDLWHFVINLTMACDIHANDLYKCFVEKNEINVKRQENGY